MVQQIKNPAGMEHTAAAKALNLPISTKHGIEISRYLRYKSTGYAKRFLEEVALLKKAVPFKRFKRDTGHKAGMAAGRYPQKAAKEFLRLIKSVEANAQVKGLDSANLKITKLLANKASIPSHGGRRRRATKRTHLEVEVRELGSRKAAAGNPVVPPPAVVKKSSPASSIASLPSLSLKKEEAPVAVAAPKPQLDTPLPNLPASSVASPAPPAVVVPPSSLLKNEEIKKKEPLSELSSEELLRRAQAKAAELKKKEKDQKDTQRVANLYEELKKKGSLRASENKGGSKKR